MEIVLGLVILVILDVAACRLGADSREGADSAEWARRLHWHAVTHHD